MVLVVLLDLVGLGGCLGDFYLDLLKLGMLISSLRIGLVVDPTLFFCITKLYKFINNSISD